MRLSRVAVQQNCCSISEIERPMMSAGSALLNARLLTAVTMPSVVITHRSYERGECGSMFQTSIRGSFVIFVSPQASQQVAPHAVPTGAADAVLWGVHGKTGVDRRKKS